MHSHEETDETFILINGSMFIEFENETIKLNEGEMIVVLKGKKGLLLMKKISLMLIEPRGISNTLQYCQ